MRPTTTACPFAMGIGLLAPAVAGCISDCGDEYTSQYDSHDDADDLKQCIEDAKREFDDCKYECTS